MKGAQILIELLKKEGVEVIFGYPGGAVIDIYDVIFETPRFSMFWCAMSREQLMRRMVMPGAQGK